MQKPQIRKNCGNVCKSWSTLSLLEEFDQFVHGHFDVAQYGTQQAGTERFAGVHGHDGTSTIFAMKEMVAAFDPKNREALFPKCGNQVVNATAYRRVRRPGSDDISGSAADV